MRPMAWIFGYGSLVWRPAFPAVERVPAALAGWTRRLWQGSPDHRGVPGAPGRVATLVPAAHETVHGVASRVEPNALDDILTALDIREQAGYARHDLPVHLRDGRRVEALVYVATADNADWLGPATADAIAAHVARSHGPSGSNVEYVRRLSRALAELGRPDPHIAAVVAALDTLCPSDAGDAR